jgi:tetratricopeptide (TPR) repeat protein
MIGQADRAVECLDGSLAIASELGLRALGHRASAGRAMLCSWRGEYEPATAIFEAVLAGWTELGYFEGQAESLRNLAEIRLETGRADQAITLAEQALARAEQVDGVWMVMGALVTLGEAYLSLGDVETARRSLTTAAELTAPGCGYWYPYAVLRLAGCHRRTGDHETATKLVGEVVENQRPRLRVRGLVELARICLAAGDHRGAVEHAGAARDLSAAYGYRPDSEDAGRVLRDAESAAYRPVHN